MPPSTPQAGRYPGTGIVGYHAYLPAYRLQRGEIAAAVGSSARGVRCYQCRTADGFEPVPASGQTARIVTVTVDRLAFSLSPPLVSAIVAFEQGGRLQVELTDVRQPPGVGDEVVPTFRRGATVGGIRNYIWKARPVYPTTSVVPASAGTERES